MRVWMAFEKWQSVFRNVCIVVVCAGSPIAAATDGSSLSDLGWMAGHWTGSVGDVATEEIWTAPLGGIILGLHRDVRSARPAFFEYLRIEQRESAVVYIASPRGEKATEFVLVSAGPAEVVFENSEHDFPQRITYRREYDVVTARIEGVVSGDTTARQWTWHLN